MNPVDTVPTDGVHHQQVRKRVSQELEQYPHPDKLKRFMDGAIYVAGIGSPLMTLPQIYKIYSTADASGVSLATWSGFTFFACFWIAYGVVHKEKPIIISYTLWVLLQATIVVGVLLY